MFAMLLCSVAFAKVPSSNARVGKSLPVWRKGYVDIHSINTGRGECSFIIFPDGTAMVIDSGEVPYKNSARFESAKQKPSDDVRPTETQAAYVRHFLPKICKDSVDYFLVTHLHNDHLGSRAMSANVRDKDGDYLLFGTSNFYRLMPFREIVDRAYPVYDTAKMKSFCVKELPHYKKFIKYSVAERGLKAEKFDLGSTSQFKMMYAPAKYDFTISNWAASGWIWDGAKAVNMYENDIPRENGASCCVLLTYGDFTYYTGGDGGTNTLVEYPVAKAIGHPVSAMKATHHFSWDTMDKSVMDIFQPKVIVSQSFNSHQPDMPTLITVFDNPCKSDVFVTNVAPVADQKYPDVTSRIKGRDGHFVIRVCPGGEYFYVFKLDDNNMDYIVTDIYGPYKSKL